MERTYVMAAAAAAAAAVVSLIGGTAIYLAKAGGDDAYAQCRQGQVGGGSVGGPFTLVDGATGKTVTDKEVITKPTLIYFGYTFCPDVCPMDMARNAEAVDILEERGIDTGLAFVTVDPARDTSKVVAAFAANIHPKAIGLTGTEDQIRTAAGAYHAYYKKQDSTDEYYLVDHSAFTYLMFPDKGFMDFYKRDTTSEQIAESVACYVSAAEGQN